MMLAILFLVNFFILLWLRLSADVQDFKSSFKMVISQGLRSVTQTVGCVVSLLIISPQVHVYMCGMLSKGTMVIYYMYLECTCTVTWEIFVSNFSSLKTFLWIEATHESEMREMLVVDKYLYIYFLLFTCPTKIL